MKIAPLVQFMPKTRLSMCRRLKIMKPTHLMHPRVPQLVVTGSVWLPEAPPRDLDLKADTATEPTTASHRCTSRRLRRTRHAATGPTTAAAGPADSTGEDQDQVPHTSCTLGFRNSL
jgi:hypothetical protein